jgi:hypothetical protein
LELEFYVTTDTALIEKREELKRRLAAGEYKTLVDVILDRAGQTIQKITRSSQPISPWYSSLMLYLMFLLLGFAGLYLMGEASAFTKQFPTFSVSFVPLSLFVGYLNVVSIVAGNIYIHRVFTAFHDSLVDKIESITDLDDFERWLTAVCNRKMHFVFSIVGGVLVGSYQISVLRDTGIIVLPSTAIGTILLNTFSIVFLYLLIYMIVLSARIGHYHLRLYTAYPASSEVINRLADLLSGFVYLVAFYATLLTLLVAIQRLLIPLGVLVILLFWIPIMGMFVLNQSSLSSIIRKSKWKALNGIQAKVEQLHLSEKLGEKETTETINRLMDYHDRVNATRNSALDLRATLNFVNSLLLPLLAFLLGNLDFVLSLFARQP